MEEMYIFAKNYIVSKEAFTEYKKYKVTSEKTETSLNKYSIFGISLVIFLLGLITKDYFMIAIAFIYSAIWLNVMYIIKKAVKQKKENGEKIYEYGDNIEENVKNLQEEYDRMSTAEKTVKAEFYDKYIAYSFGDTYEKKYKYRLYNGIVEGDSYFALRFLERSGRYYSVRELLFDKNEDENKIKQIIAEKCKKKHVYRYKAYPGGSVDLEIIE